jgi:hypothetical protein
MVREDNNYIDEWVDYHLSIGFEHVLIYDHKSIKPIEPKWGDKVTVKRIDVDLPFKEYLHLSTFRDFKPFWMMTCDVDEFLVLLQHRDVRDLLVNYEQFGGLGIPWSMYGSSGHVNRPEGLVRDSYLWRTLDTPDKQYVKTIANTQFFTNMNDPHFVYSSRPVVNEAFEPFSGSLATSPRKIVKLNHYFTRSYDEWVLKRNRGTGYPNVPIRPMEWFYGVLNGSTVYDPIISNVKWNLRQLWEYGKHRIYPTSRETFPLYLDYYDKAFLPYKEKPINIFEVGSPEGGSCKLWEDYFLQANIRNIDTADRHIPVGNTESVRFNSSRVRFEVVDFNALTPEYFSDFPVDIAIDSRPNNTANQVAFIGTMYPFIREGGMLIIEDVKDIDDLAAIVTGFGHPYEIIDLRQQFNRPDSVLFIIKKEVIVL